MIKTMNKGEVIIYQAPDGNTRLDVKLDSETVWLNRQQMPDLFDRDIKTIGKHINNALKEELEDIPTVAKFATVQKEGNRNVERNIEHYNLDMIRILHSFCFFYKNKPYNTLIL